MLSRRTWSHPVGVALSLTSLWAVAIAWAVLRTEPIPNMAGRALVTIVGLLGLSLLVWRLTEVLPWPRVLNARFVSIHLVAGLGFGLLWRLPVTQLPSGVGRSGTVAFSVLAGFWFYGMISASLYTLQLGRLVQEARARAARLDDHAQRLKLSALNGQLNPHFLFNAIHGLILACRSDAGTGRSALRNFAHLLDESHRHAERGLVTLAEEVRFTNRYLHLQGLRFGERLRVEMRVSGSASRWMVPSYSLQIAVENAIRHGVAPRVGPGTVEIDCTVKAGVLEIRVSDDGLGLRDASEQLNQGGGLQLLRERLDLIWSGSARLALSSRAGGGAETLVEMPPVASGSLHSIADSGVSASLEPRPRGERVSETDQARLRHARSRPETPVLDVLTVALALSAPTLLLGPLSFGLADIKTATAQALGLVVWTVALLPWVWWTTRRWPIPLSWEPGWIVARVVETAAFGFCWRLPVFVAAQLGWMREPRVLEYFVGAWHFLLYAAILYSIRINRERQQQELAVLEKNAEISGLRVSRFLQEEQSDFFAWAVARIEERFDDGVEAVCSKLQALADHMRRLVDAGRQERVSLSDDLAWAAEYRDLRGQRPSDDPAEAEPLSECS